LLLSLARLVVADFVAEVGDYLSVAAALIF